MKSFDRSSSNIPHAYQEAFEVLPTFLEIKVSVPVPQALRGNNHAEVLSLNQICVGENVDVVSEIK